MIGSALERGSLICAFDEHGMTLFSKAKGSGPNDGLLGFSGSTVTVRFGSIIYTYDEKGMTLYAKAARRSHDPAACRIAAIARSRSIALLIFGLCALIASSTCPPTRITGFSEVIGS